MNILRVMLSSIRASGVALILIDDWEDETVHKVLNDWLEVWLMIKEKYHE